MIDLDEMKRHARIVREQGGYGTAADLMEAAAEELREARKRRPVPPPPAAPRRRSGREPEGYQKALEVALEFHEGIWPADWAPVLRLIPFGSWKPWAIAQWVEELRSVKEATR